jgi:hypothetical protein
LSKRSWDRQGPGLPSPSKARQASFPTGETRRRTVSCQQFPKSRHTKLSVGCYALPNLPLKIGKNLLAHCDAWPLATHVDRRQSPTRRSSGATAYAPGGGGAMNSAWVAILLTYAAPANAVDWPRAVVLQRDWPSPGRTSGAPRPSVGTMPSSGSAAYTAQACWRRSASSALRSPPACQRVRRGNYLKGNGYDQCWCLPS